MNFPLCSPKLHCPVSVMTDHWKLHLVQFWIRVTHPWCLFCCPMFDMNPLLSVYLTFGFVGSICFWFFVSFKDPIRRFLCCDFDHDIVATIRSIRMLETIFFRSGTSSEVTQKPNSTGTCALDARIPTSLNLINQSKAMTNSKISSTKNVSISRCFMMFGKLVIGPVSSRNCY